mgnify:CR=1 FL=1
MLCSISHLLEEEAIEKLTRLEDEYQKTEEDMMKVRNLGRKSLDEVVAKLSSLGFGLSQEED